MPKAPIVLFVYNRPRHTEQCLESLSRCEGADESELFIYCDGSKHPKDASAIETVRRLVKSQNWCGKVYIIEREENMGLANSIIAGVTEVMNRFGRVIVLEDDLVLSPQFLNYMNDALEIYKDEEKVMHISGYMFPVKEELPETFFYRATSCWGWATWKRAWDKLEHDVNILLAELRKDINKRKKFNIEGLTKFYELIEAKAKGKIDSWAALWYPTVFLNGGLCLHPGRSLVNNIGHDSSGVHCSNVEAFDVELHDERITEFTRDIRESEDVVNAMVNFYRTLKRPLLVRILDRILMKKSRS
jgi:hypothetical protein